MQTQKYWLVVNDNEGNPILTVDAAGTVKHFPAFSPDKLLALFDANYPASAGTPYDLLIALVVGRMRLLGEKFSTNS